MRSAAAAAVAVSATTAPSPSTEVTGDDRMQSQTIPTYTGYLEGMLDIAHAHGIMHAVGQVTASSSAAGGAVKCHSQVPCAEGGGTGEVQRQRLLAESTGNRESTQEVVVKGTAVQEVAPRSPSEGLLHGHNVNDLTWYQVCLRVFLPSQKYVCAVPSHCTSVKFRFVHPLMWCCAVRTGVLGLSVWKISCDPVFHLKHQKGSGMQHLSSCLNKFTRGNRVVCSEVRSFTQLLGKVNLTPTWRIANLSSKLMLAQSFTVSFPEGVF
jgi:hypothetical protein